MVTLLEGAPVREKSTSSTRYELFCIPKNLSEVVALPAADLLEGGKVCGFDTTIRHFLSSKDINVTRAFVEGKKLLSQYYEGERVRGAQRRLKRAEDAKRLLKITTKIITSELNLS